VARNRSTRTSEKVAKAFNTNRTYLNEAKKLKTENPEAFKDIKEGKKTITEVKKEQKIQKKLEEIENLKKAIDQETVVKTDAKYDVIAIDPPWNYGRVYDPDNSRVASPYPEMDYQELAKLDIPAKENAVLWLWTTHRFIWDAKALMDHWGFTYKAILVWNKEKLGMGSWLRMQCEFCLVGIKGTPLWELSNHRDIITEGRRQHSRKPDGFYELVNSINYGKKLDFFSREAREGWDQYGNDTKKF